jgi:carboxypeptidase Q
MIFRRVHAACLILLLVICCVAQPADELQKITNQLASSVLMGPSMPTLWELSDGFGGRLSGSAAYQASAEWALKKFASYGLQNVHYEPFEIPNGWQRGTARGELIAPMVRPLHVASIAWCPSTPEGGIEGEVVVVDDLLPDHIKSQAAQIKGCIVLLDTSRAFEQA